MQLYTGANNHIGNSHRMQREFISSGRIVPLEASPESNRFATTKKGPNHIKLLIATEKPMQQVGWRNYNSKSFGKTFCLQMTLPQPSVQKSYFHCQGSVLISKLSTATSK